MNKIIDFPAWISFHEENSFNDIAWLYAFREKERKAFIKNGLPTKKNERFKYSDFSFLNKKKFVNANVSLHDEVTLKQRIDRYRLSEESILLTFLNGHFCSSLSEIHSLPAGTVMCSLSEALKKQEALVKKYFKKHWHDDIHTARYPFASLNSAFFSDGLFLYLQDQCEITKPIHLLFIATDEHEFASHPHHVIVLGKKSKATIFQDHVALSASSYLMNAVTSIDLGEESQLTHYKIQNESQSAIHFATTFVYQAQESKAAFFNFSLGGLFSRDDLIVQLQAERSHCELLGFYRLNQDDQYVDHHIEMEHSAPYCTSEMLYKGILDQKSRAVFNGRLVVKQGAEKTIAYQGNHHLLLSKEAESYSKPELEIYADEVKCKHGATTGQLNHDMLFYLQSRGIPQEEAKRMLLKGFSEEIIQRISHPAIQQSIEARLK